MLLPFAVFTHLMKRSQLLQFAIVSTYLSTYADKFRRIALAGIADIFLLLPVNILLLNSSAAREVRSASVYSAVDSGGRRFGFVNYWISNKAAS